MSSETDTKETQSTGIDSSIIMGLALLAIMALFFFVIIPNRQKKAENEKFRNTQKELIKESQSQ